MIGGLNNKSIFITLMLGLGLTLALVGLLGLSATDLQAARAAGFTVCQTGPPTCDYSVVQDAVDAAGDGDVIKVAAGTYADVNNHGGLVQAVYIYKSVTIRGGYTPAFTDPPYPAANPTTLDAGGLGRVLYITENISPTIEGLRITGGDAAALGGDGGGVYSSNATAIFKHNQVFSNTANIGGGMWLHGDNITLNDNTISRNSASFGGGLDLAGNGIKLIGNTFISNTATQGGGMSLSGDNNALVGNTITANTAVEGAGGVFLWESSAALTGNTISENSAGWGGGVQMGFGDFKLINNIIADNRADSPGSGVLVDTASAHMLHNTIARNREGEGTGIYVGDSATMVFTNTILVSHTVGIDVQPGGTAMFEATLWGSGAWANGIDWVGGGTIISTNNLWDDPAFVAPDAGDYHIGSGSAAADEGIDGGVNTDIDYQPRPYQAPDLGADEYWPPGVLKFVYLPSVLK